MSGFEDDNDMFKETTFWKRSVKRIDDALNSIKFFLKNNKKIFAAGLVAGVSIAASAVLAAVFWPATFALALTAVMNVGIGTVTIGAVLETLGLASPIAAVASLSALMTVAVSLVTGLTGWGRAPKFEVPEDNREAYLAQQIPGLAEDNRHRASPVASLTTGSRNPSQCGSPRFFTLPESSKHESEPYQPDDPATPHSPGSNQ